MFTQTDTATGKEERNALKTIEGEDSLPSLCVYSLLAETTGHMADEDKLQYNDNVKKGKRSQQD